MDRSCWTPEVVCLAGRGELIEPLKRAGVPVTCLNARSRFDLTVVFRLWRHFRSSQPEVVQTFLFHANLAGRLAGRLAGIPVVVCGIRVAERRRWHLCLDRITDRLVDRHVCVSHSVAEFSATQGRLPPEKLVVIPNAVDGERFASAAPADLSEFGIDTSERLILFVGRLDEQKNPILLIEAFRKIADEFPDTRLMVVGSGPLAARLESLAADLADRVIFAGYRTDVPALLRAACCLALPSRWEGMPNVVLEAMAAGIPVVASDAEGIDELLRGGSLGSIVRHARPDAWAEALRTVLLKSPEVTKMAQNAQRFSLNEFTSNKMVAAYGKLYGGLLEGVEIGDSGNVVRAAAANRGKI